MSGETTTARELVREAMAQAEADPKRDRDSMGRALINAVVAEFVQYRSVEDVASELRYLAESLDDDEFVITRGC